MSVGRILVVEDEESLRRVTTAQLETCGYHTVAAADVGEALEVLHKHVFDLVLTDLNLPGESGLDLLKEIRLEYPETVVVLVTAFGSIETAVEAIRHGAYDYLTKPVHPDELKAVVKRVLERQQLLEEVQQLRSAVNQKYGFENVIGHSGKFLYALETAGRVASSDATVLIRGETGTGKEVVARAIHFNSPRRNRPFAVINCGSIPRELLESELFGHTKGAFTGALNHKVGKVEAANGGTVFLDEIGEMPLDLQVRVLRLVQEHEIEKVGATAPTHVNVRIIAATHRNLEAMAAERHFPGRPVLQVGRNPDYPASSPRSCGRHSGLRDRILQSLQAQEPEAGHAAARVTDALFHELPLARQRARTRERHRVACIDEPVR